MIEAIAIAIAVLGAVLLLILFARIRAVDAELKLKKHRAKDAGLADLLNYAAVVDDGVIVGKNGSFMAAWLYKGDDNASSTEEQREMVSFRINQALAGLGNGWMVHVDAVRRPAPNYSERGVSSFPDSVSFAIDEERRRLFEGLGAMFEGYFVLTVTWFPPVLAQRKFVELMFDDDAVAPDHTARTTGLIAQFKREITSLESRLSSAVKMTRLRGQKVVSEEGREVTHDDFLSWLQFCVTGLHHPVMLPSNPMYLDAVIGGQELWGGVVPKIGRKFIQVVAIEGFPLESTPGVLSALAELPSEYRWSSRFIFMDQHESLKHLDKFRKKWKQKIRGFFDQVFNTNTGSINQDAAAMVGDAEAAIAEVNSGLVAAGYYTSVVVLMDEDRERLAASALLVEKAVNRLAFAARIETINTLDAYLGSLPGHGVENVRRPLINTMNLADLLPTSSIWTGSATAPCSMGHLLDAEEDGLSLSDFTVFEIEELMNLGEKFALPVLLYLFRRIERALKGQPSVIILDEAWLMLGHPAFRAKIREWLKVLRKANCLVLMATQSLSDAANSGILDVIVESTATKIFLPNVYARDEDTSALYRRMGLNARQIEILATAIPKRQYYYVSENGRRLYDLALGPMALAFVGASDKESVATIKSLEAKFGHEWVHEWLAGRGLNLNDYLEAA